MATTVVTYDKPGFEGHVLEEDGRIVCILAPTAFTDTGIQARIRRLMQGQGIDCTMCRGCPVGRTQ
jgi:hypothetical protein